MIKVLFNFDNLSIFIFIFFILFFGLFFLLIFFRDFFKKNNLFLNLSYSWFFGNAVLSFLIFLLFIFKKLSLINFNNFISLFITLFLLFLILIFKIKDEVKINRSNFFYFTLLLIFFIPLIIESLTSFLIGWDALAIWLFKAKALFLNQDILSLLRSKSFYYTSLAYPLGIPLIVSFYYRIIGQINDQAVQFYFVCFFLSMAFLFFGLLLKFFEKYFPKFFLFLITLSLMISSIFIIYSHNAYVDLQLGYIFLTIFSLFYSFISKKEDNPTYSKLIILGLGYSLMIKNEALPFSLIVLFLLIFIFSLRWGFFNFFRKNFFYFLSFLPFLFWEVYRRVNLIPSFLDGNLIPKKENFIRLKVVFNYFLLEYFNTAKYGLNLIIVLFLIVFFGTILFYKRKIKEIIPLVVILFSQIISYFYVFLITPFPYIVQLESSLERIFLQFVPLIYFLAIVFIFEGIKTISQKIDR